MRYYKIIYSHGGTITNEIPDDTRVVVVKEGIYKDKVGLIKREGDQIYVKLENDTRVDIALEDVTSEFDMKVFMFNKIRDSFYKINTSILNPTFQNCLKKINSLEVRESFGVGIFTTANYSANELIIVDLSTDTYNFEDRWSSDSLGPNKSLPYLSFYNTENYGRSHGLSGDGEDGRLPLFPMMGLLNYSDNPNCCCHFNTLSADRQSVIGLLFAFKDISEGEQLTISYLGSYEQLYEKFYSEFKRIKSKNLENFDLSEEDIIFLKDFLAEYYKAYPSIEVSYDYIDLLLFLIKMEGNVDQIISEISRYDNEFLKIESFKLLSKMNELYEREIQLFNSIFNNPKLSEDQKIRLSPKKQIFENITKLLNNEFFDNCKLMLQSTSIITSNNVNNILIKLSDTI